MIQKQQITLHQISQKDIDQILKFVSVHYIADEPCSIHLGVQPEQFSKAFYQLILNCCCSGFSYYYKKDQKIISVLICLPYQQYLQPLQTSQKVRPIQIMVQALQKRYSIFDVKRTICLYIGCTHPEYKRKGLFLSLVKIVEEKCKQKGYIQCIAECTNKKSENGLKKAGYEERVRLFYKQFQYKGYIPFQGIKNSDSMSLISKKLI